MTTNLVANVERFNGFADTYDKYRPQPPAILLDILTQLAQVERPRLVVDLGSGTGLSTRVWVDRAEQIIGVEPSDDMRRQSKARATGLANVRFQRGYSHETGLPDACAEIATASQSLHWMDPPTTFTEIARILRPGGVFAAYDADWPPTLNWKAEKLYDEFDTRAEEIGAARGFYRGVKQWNKSEHLARMQASDKFRFVKELVVHHIELGNAERLVGLALSQGGVATLLKRGMTEAEIGVPEFRARAQELLGDAPSPWYFSYRVRVGII
ncbi:MAG: class I SAM-dependent methyltransferase [Chloroflexi bacterium]|nr:class I SAM-dependent methyltransferase [Chloroflexota bacterium]